jgi:hypothetical protein
MMTESIDFATIMGLVRKTNTKDFSWLLNALAPAATRLSVVACLNP